VPTTSTEQIEVVKKIVYKGEYNKALKKINTLVKKEDLTKEELVRSKILQSRVLKLVNQHNKALDIIENILKNAILKKKPLLKLDTLILKGDVLLLMGRYNEALTIINKVDKLIEKNKETHEEEIVSREAYHNFVKGNAFLKKGHTKEAIQQMKISLDLWKKSDNKQEIARVLRNIGKCYSDRGEFAIAIDHLERSYEISMGIDNMMDSIHPLGYIAEIYYKRGDIDKTIEYYQKRLELSEKAKFDYGIISSNFFIGFCFNAQGKFDKAQKHLTISIELSKKTKNYRMLGLSLGTFGLQYKLTGELDESIKYYKEAISVFEKIGYKHTVAEYLNNIGEIHLFKGDLSKALDIYKSSLLIFEEVGKTEWVINTQRNIGDVYSLLGDLDESLNYYFKALDYYSRKDYKIQISQCMYNVGGIYWRKGELDQAKNYLDQSLEIVKDFGNQLITAKILLDLVSINLDDSDVTKATKHFKELDAIDKKLKNKLVHQQTRFAEALIFMNSENERDQGKAEILFEQIVEEDIIYQSLTVNALLNLCESLLMSFRETNKEDTLKSLNALVEKLLGISEQQKSVSLLAESYWLKYQLLILDDWKLEEAEVYLNKANQIAKEYDLTNLVKKFAKQKNIIDKGLREILADDKTIRIPVEKLPDHLKMMDSIKDLKKQSNVVVAIDSVDKKIWEFRIT